MDENIAIYRDISRDISSFEELRYDKYMYVNILRNIAIYRDISVDISRYIDIGEAFL